MLSKELATCSQLILQAIDREKNTDQIRIGKGILVTKDFYLTEVKKI